MTDLAFYSLASQLLVAVNTELASSTAGSPERVCIVAGVPSWDECECGQLTVSIESSYLSEAFPTAWQVTSACAPTILVANLVVQIVRCAPTVSESGVLPSCVQLDASAQTVIADAYNTLVATRCFFDGLKAADSIYDWVLGTQTFATPEGGCVGSVVTATVALDLL